MGGKGTAVMGGTWVMRGGLGSCISLSGGEMFVGWVASVGPGGVSSRAGDSGVMGALSCLGSISSFSVGGSRGLSRCSGGKP